MGRWGTALTRSYKVDLDANLGTVRAVKAALATHGYELTECRIMDLFTWAYAGETSPPWVSALADETLPADTLPGEIDEVAELAADTGAALDELVRGSQWALTGTNSLDDEGVLSDESKDEPAKPLAESV